MPIIVDLTPAEGSSLGLCAIFLNAAVEPADFVALRYAGDSLSISTTADVEVRRLANRTRLIRKGTGAVAQLESMGVTFQRCSPTDVAWLRDHVGQLVCVRDHVGGKFFGVYTDVARDVATAWRDRSTVKITLEQVTYSEAV